MTDTDSDGRETPEPLAPAEAEREIRNTRAELARTLDALERKLAARQLVEKGFDMFKDSVSENQTVNRGIDMIRSNPVPVALIGIGAAWLIAANTGAIDRIAHDERVEAARKRLAGMASDVGHRAGEAAATVAERVGLSGSQHGSAELPLGHTGNTLVDQAGGSNGDGWIHQVTGIAQGALRSARDSSGAILNRAGNFAGGGASRVADQVGHAFERNPLVVGAMGVMAGALVAALLPLSRLENELLGTKRDELWHKAEQAGEEAVSRVRDAAAQAAVRAVDVAAGAATEGVRTLGDKPSQR
jgi:hypothetical protein